jgi:hypothetical protein
VIKWLIEKYDDVLNEDERWRLAKCQIQSDAVYHKLYTGRSILLEPQSFSRVERKINKLEKKPMASSGGKMKLRKRGPKARKAGKPRRRNRNRTKNGPKRPQLGPRMFDIQGLNKQSVPRRKRALAGQGGTKTFQRGERSCTIQEDEYVAEVVGAATGANFQNTVFPINPGQSALFPWLSKQAAQWEKYHFNYLEFYYQREVSEFATAGTTGKVILQVDFDASDAPPTSKQQMLDTDPNAAGMPCENISLVLPSARIHALYKTLYIRPGGLPGASDIKTYDAGNFNIATQAIASNTATLGELRVRYSVTLSVPVLETATGVPANNSVVVLEDTTLVATAATTVNAIAPMAKTAVGGLGQVNTAGSIVFPPGNYKYDANVQFLGTGNTTIMSFTLNKNGVTIGSQSPAWVCGGLTGVEIMLSQSGFFSSDGTAASAITLVENSTFTTGAVSANARLTVLAV